MRGHRTRTPWPCAERSGRRATLVLTVHSFRPLPVMTDQGLHPQLLVRYAMRPAGFEDSNAYVRDALTGRLKFDRYFMRPEDSRSGPGTMQRPTDRRYVHSRPAGPRVSLAHPDGLAVDPVSRAPRLSRVCGRTERPVWRLPGSGRRRDGPRTVEGKSSRGHVTNRSHDRWRAPARGRVRRERVRCSRASRGRRMSVESLQCQSFAFVCRSS